jgi:hypothetical protein
MLLPLDAADHLCEKHDIFTLEKTRLVYVGETTMFSGRVDSALKQLGHVFPR